MGRKGVLPQAVDQTTWGLLGLSSEGRAGPGRGAQAFTFPGASQSKGHTRLGGGGSGNNN